MDLSEPECRRRFARARVARLVTADRAGVPYVVPVTFAVGDGVYTAVDHKPKRTPDLRRIRNIRANPLVSLLVDEAGSERPTRWWVLAEGVAELFEDHPRLDGPLDLLAAKYPQYRKRRPAGPLIAVSVTRWTGWVEADGP